VTAAVLDPPDLSDPIEWHCLTELRKWHTDDDTEHLIRPEDELIVIEGNLLTYGGASALFNRLIATTVTAFDNANAMIGVGTSATAAANTQTTLVAQTLRKAMASTYPQHTDATTVGGSSIVFRSDFLTGEANAVWAEWGIFNGALTTGAAAGGRMLNRVVQALGTKTSGTWQLTLTLTLA
jgi:hypothetical protein